MANYTREQIETDGLPFTLSYLLPVISATSTITYGEIARRLEVDLKISGRIFSTQIGGVAGALMIHLHKVDKSIPLVNVLVVRQGATLPSSGADDFMIERFIGKNGLGKPMTPELKSRLCSQAFREVYRYKHWHRVYEKAFGKQAPPEDLLVLDKGVEKDGRAAGEAKRKAGNTKPLRTMSTSIPLR